MRCVVRSVLLLVCLVVSSAAAEPWYRGRHGRNRVVHLSATIGGGLLSPATGRLESRWAPSECRWCTPTSIDRDVRSALRWDDETWARRSSHVAAFALPSLICGGLVLLHTPPTWADVLDNGIPIAESMVVAIWLTRALKVGVGRQRPYAHYGTARDEGDNLSFPSGHTSRAFAVGVSAAVVARARRYRSEPYIWGATGVIGVTTAYLRIAADKHYATDVLSGAVLGTAVGLTVPWLMKRDIEVVPARGGLALAGMW